VLARILQRRETPNLAARLQALAEPGAHIITAAQSWSSATVVSSPDTSAMACSPISATRGPMNMMLSARFVPRFPWSRQCPLGTLRERCRSGVGP
jgi:hypothetical protein